MSEPNKSYRVLNISAYPPSRSGGLVKDSMNALKSAGHDVDFFTLFAFRGQEKNHYNVYPEPLTDKLLRLRKLFPFLNVFHAVAKLVLKSPEEKMTSVENHGFRIPHLSESEPPVDNELLLESLPKKSYDFVQVFITERMLTAKSFLAIYEKYKVPILILCLDMLHFTGGCYFFGECNRYKVGCGKCLVLNSEEEKDQTYLNFLYKKSIYPRIEYAILCNQHQRAFALESNLFNEKNIYNQSIIIDEDKFIPMDGDESRKYFKVPQKKKFIVLARYEKGLTRAKGYDHLVEIMNAFTKLSHPLAVESSLLILIGSEDKEFTRRINMDTLSLGRLDLEELVKIYSASSVFISTSVDDVGPSMVNQSLMCGTPVVTFTIGTALEVTEDGVNGFKAENFNSCDFANKLLLLSQMSTKELAIMKQNARLSALKFNSKHSNARRIIEVYESVKNSYKTGVLKVNT